MAYGWVLNCEINSFNAQIFNALEDWKGDIKFNS